MTVQTASVLFAATLMLAGCQSFIPRDEDPVRPAAFPVAVQAGPSSQRLDEDGYPMIGAYPGAATSQVSDETVAETEARYAGVAARGATRGGAGYESRVRELRARRSEAVAAASR